MGTYAYMHDTFLSEKIYSLFLFEYVIIFAENFE